MTNPKSILAADAANTITIEMVQNFFTGAIAHAEAEAVKALLDGVIAELVANDDAYIESIATTLRDKHGLEVSETYVSDYFTGYAERHLPQVFTDIGAEATFYIHSDLTKGEYFTGTLSAAIEVGRKNAELCPSDVRIFLTDDITKSGKDEFDFPIATWLWQPVCHDKSYFDEKGLWDDFDIWHNLVENEKFGGQHFLKIGCEIIRNVFKENPAILGELNVAEIFTS
jgi:hypothetical protein